MGIWSQSHPCPKREEKGQQAEQEERREEPGQNQSPWAEILYDFKMLNDNNF